jgi:acetyl-CoA acyltransferase
LSNNKNMFPGAVIPYGTWGSSFFPTWQTSALAEVNIGQFAGEAMSYILGKRNVRQSEIDYLVSGSTIPWHWKFWGSPFLSSTGGHRVGGHHIEQACATGLQAIIHAGSEVNMGSSEVCGVLTFDRTSDSPVGIFPERRTYERTQALADVWDNFGFDPATGNSMIASAGNAARKHKIEKSEVDEISFLRHKQYFDSLESGALDNVLVPLEVLGVQGKSIGKVESDIGTKPISMEALRAQRELDSCVTSGTQTHAADGMATMLVSTPEKAKELSSRPEILIQFVGKTEYRTSPSMMPEAPALTVQKLLKRMDLSLGDMAVIKNHNPFAVNDAIFGKLLDFDWAKLNNTGCPLVWGHPQGPTLTRVTIEALEEAVSLGGGYVLVFGCAAGDVGIATIFKVSDGGLK